MKICVVCGHTEFQMLFSHKGGKMGRCFSCGLVQLVPIPTSSEIARLYHEDFDHFTPYIEQLDVHRAYFRQKLRDIRKKFTISKRQRVKLLDIGCAMGVLLEEAQEQGMETIGVDISQGAVSYCKGRGLTVLSGTIQS